MVKPFTIMRKQSLVLIAGLLSLAGGLNAQAWSGVISSGRAVDWSKAGVTGGVPNRTTICTTLNAGATATQINNAIQNCPSGQVVFLNAGTYNISGGLVFNNKSNVTLRGAGADQTKLVFSSSYNCDGEASDVCFISGDVNWNGGPTNLANWTAGYAPGTTVITLDSTSNLAVGDPVTLDQADDTADTGQVFVCETYALGCTEDGPSGGGSGGQRNLRAQQQIVTVTAINGKQVTISPGVYMPNWRSSQTPQAWWASTPIFSSSVENMSLDHTAAAPDSGILFFNCSGCWVKGVKSLQPNRSHVHLIQSAKCVVRDSYFYGTANAASQSYGVEVFPAGDSLIENNIFQHVAAPQVMNAACSGCVIAYNYSIDDYNTLSPGWMAQSAFMHAGGIDNLLLEGNIGAGIYSDLFHGSHNFVTLFRNRYNGYETGKTSMTVPVALWPKSRYYNIVGNVLGDTALPHTIYQFGPGSTGNSNAAIYVIGTGATYSPDDPLVLSTLMRWGNYDIVNNAVRFVSSEIPSSLSQFANSVPASQTLPASFYLSARPGWFVTPWGTPPWPAVGPDVTGGNIANVGGHAYMIPAELCYTNLTKDSNGILNFSAATCYGSSTTPTAPAAPTAVSAVVH